MDAYRKFWSKNTSKVFEVTVLWGLLFGTPAALFLLAYSQWITNFGLTFVSVGELLDEQIGQEWSYQVTIFAFQLGVVGGTLFWLPAALKAFDTFALGLRNAFAPYAFLVYTLFFLGAQFALTCFVRLRIAGTGSDNTPVVGALLLVGIVGIAVTLRVWHKIKETE